MLWKSECWSKDEEADSERHAGDSDDLSWSTLFSDIRRSDTNGAAVQAALLASILRILFYGWLILYSIVRSGADWPAQNSQ